METLLITIGVFIAFHMIPAIGVGNASNLAFSVARARAAPTR